MLSTFENNLIADDERFEFGDVVEPFADIELDFDTQTGSDWYNIALSASLGGKTLHGFSYSATSETIAKSDFNFSEKHACGWIRTNEVEVAVDAPGEEWDEHIYAAPLHTGVVTGSQLSMMFDTGAWEPSTATRARNAAYLAAGMVSHGTSLERSLEISSKIVGDDVPEDAVLNTSIPVSHLKREAASGAKASHAIFSRMNAQRYIRWDDNQLHKDILPPNAAIDWARITVLARYIGEANVRYDPNFRLLAQTYGVPYKIVRGAWAYVSEADFHLDSPQWANVPEPQSASFPIGFLADAYTVHASVLMNQVMRVYNELATGSRDANLEALLRLIESIKPRKRDKYFTLSVGTDVLAPITSHKFTAESAAEAVARSATTYNAIAQAFGEYVLPDRFLTEKASQILAIRHYFDEAHELLESFYPLLASHFTWVRAFEILDKQLQNYKTSLNRLNRLHRSMTCSSATIEVDVAVTPRVKDRMSGHIRALLKKILVKGVPEIKIPRYVTDIRSAIARGYQSQLIHGMAEHFHTYRVAWAERYEDWAKVYALAGGHLADSVKYGAASSAFEHLTVECLLSPTSGYIDGANIRTSYLYLMASNYARKRKLRKPPFTGGPIASAEYYASLLDEQYNPEVPFTECEKFARIRLDMFATDLASKVEPKIPEEDAPEIKPPTPEPPAEKQVTAEAPMGDEEAAMQAMLEQLLGGGVPVISVTKEQVIASYPTDITPEFAAKANGYETFDDAFNDLGEKARFDVETPFTQKTLASLNSISSDEEESGIAIH